MRVIILVLACSACKAFGRRIIKDSVQAEDGLDAEQRLLRKVSNAARTLDARSETQQSNSHPPIAPNKYRKALLASLLLAVNPGADAFAVSNAAAVTQAGRVQRPDSNPSKLRHQSAKMQMGRWGRGGRTRGTGGSSHDGGKHAHHYDNVHKEVLHLPGELRVGQHDLHGRKQSYRFIHNDNPEPQEMHGSIQNPYMFTSTQSEGTYKKSNLVTFTLPRNDKVAPHIKTIELLPSNEKGVSSFGAVEVKLPLNLHMDVLGVGELFSGETRAVVTNAHDGKAKAAQIRRGDIIRAVSMPERVSPGSTGPVGTLHLAAANILGMALPQSEEGMAILDNTGGAAYEAAINANVRANGPHAKVVLLIERPVTDEDDSDNWFKHGSSALHAGIQSILPHGGVHGKLAGAHRRQM